MEDDYYVRRCKLAQQAFLEQSQPYCDMLLDIMTRTLKGYVKSGETWTAFYTPEGEKAIEHIQIRLDEIKRRIIKDYNVEKCFELDLLEQ